MSVRRKAKITVSIDRFGYEKTEYFVGTEDEIFIEACDWAHNVALEYILDNDIDDPWAQDLIIDSTTHMIEWDESPTSVFVVVSHEGCEVYGVYNTHADAEEAIFTECESWAYEVLMTDDPMDVFGQEEWRLPEDWKWLMNDCGRTYCIYEAPIFDT